MTVPRARSANSYHIPISYEGYTRITTDLSDGIMTVTLDRPEAGNAADHAMLRDLTSFFRTVWDDARVNAILITGAGESFCGASNPGHIRARLGEGELVERIPEHRVPRLVDAMLDVPQPIVAAVNGDAIGVGISLALWSDIAIVAEDAKVGDLHVRIGVSVPQNTLLFQSCVGTARAKYLLLGSKLISGTQAADWGLVARAAPGVEVLAEARAEASELAGRPPHALRWTKRLLNQELRKQAVDHLQLSLAFTGLSLSTRDHAEALDATVEEREPRFEGR